MYTKDGLNINYSKAGMWGKGLYFAVNARYSCPGYSYKLPEQSSVYEVFLADVLIGNEIELSPNSSLLMPPEIPSIPGKHYDSVKGNT